MMDHIVSRRLLAPPPLLTATPVLYLKVIVFPLYRFSVFPLHRFSVFPLHRVSVFPLHKLSFQLKFVVTNRYLADLSHFFCKFPMGFYFSGTNTLMTSLYLNQLYFGLQVFLVAIKHISERLKNIFGDTTQDDFLNSNKFNCGNFVM